MSAELRFVVEGEPVPKGRPRFAGHAYTPGRTRDAEEEVRIQALTATTGKSWFLLDGYRYGVEMRFYRSTARPVDLDNLVKLATDACNGVLWLDDSQIVHWVARKERDRDNPRTEVRVWLVGEGGLQ